MLHAGADWDILDIPGQVVDCLVTDSFADKLTLPLSYAHEWLPTVAILLSRTECCVILVLLGLVACASALAPTFAGGAVGQPGGGGHHKTPPHSVPLPKSPVLLFSGVLLAHRIRWKEVKGISVIEAYIERIKQVNLLLNAVVKDRFEAALEEGCQVDQLLSEGHDDEDSLEEKFPFLGVPITIKEAFGLHELPNTSGLVNRRNAIATSDAIVVSRVKQAGAIPMGVTNCSELCMWFESSNRVYGRTNNPYDLEFIVGGSSGGEGCVLAAAGSVIGVVSDIGGSFRMLAFFSGIFGHKPISGVVPNDGQFPNARSVQMKFLSTSPMCRFAEDLEPLLRVMAGPNVTKLKLDGKVSLENVKFYSMEEDEGSIFVSPVDKEILQAQRNMVKYLETDLGIQVQHVNTNMLTNVQS